MTAAAPSKLKLPAKLADLDLKFGKALNVHVPAIWPTADDGDAEKFVKAEQAEAIAQVFIRSSSVHGRLANARICYLFRPDITQAGRQKGGVAAKASSKVHYLTEFDFVIDLNHEVWLKLTPEQRLALVDHELAHCERDDETGAWMMRDHDVEEFSDVVHRWGLWTMPLRGFGIAIEKAQIDLFEGTAVGLIASAATEVARSVRDARNTPPKKRGKTKVTDDAGDLELEDDDE